MRKLLYLIVAIVLLGLALNPLAQALPQGQGVQMLPPGEALGQEPEYIGIFWYGLPNPPQPPEIYTGTWVSIYWGWGSGSEETLLEIIEGIEIEFYFNGKEIKDPTNSKYFRIEHRITYWVLFWAYRHPPLKPGEYTWAFAMGGSVPAFTADGAFTVIEGE